MAVFLNWAIRDCRWAKTVVTGRARLNGIPLALIVVETRTVEAVIPADPANPESQQQVLQQAGQVWYPDSAYKVRVRIEERIGVMGRRAYGARLEKVGGTGSLVRPSDNPPNNPPNNHALILVFLIFFHRRHNRSTTSITASSFR